MHLADICHFLFNSFKDKLIVFDRQSSFGEERHAYSEYNIDRQMGSAKG